MRACEIKGLQWKDVDFTAYVLNIRRSKTPAGWRGPVTQEDWDAGRKGLIQATVLKMNDDEARDLAERIATFAYDIRQYGQRYRYDRDFRAQLNEELLSIIDASDTEQ